MNSSSCLLVLFFILAGCVDSTAVRQYAECEHICLTTRDSCGDGFIVQDCMDYCVSQPADKLEDFHICASCFVAVSCDIRSYAHVCYPSCNL